MKTYEVLEAHQGDKAYKPGDPITGTRIADPNEVGHLVALGLLKEIGDAPAPAPEAPTHEQTVTELKRQVETLTGERDAALGDLASLREAHELRKDENATLQAQVETLTGELAAKAAPAKSSKPAREA